MAYPKNNKYFQGLYTPINKDKYKGSTSPSYRSSLEKNFFLYFDKNPNVVAWASESIVIPYYNDVDKKVHKYYIDLIAAIKDPNGEVQKYLIELKPYAQTQPPKQSNKKKSSTVLYENLMYHQNQCKWKAAHEYAAKKGMKFIILTEKFLTTH
jgi:hypothetical protein